MSCGIYKMTNNTNNKIYIGLSVCIETRMYNHFWSAKHTTSNEYDSYLCRAIRKYGEGTFSYEIIEECAVSELAEKERYAESPLCQEVNLLDNNGNIVKTYTSGREAELELDLPRGKVSEVCNGKRKHTKNYKFEWGNPIKRRLINDRIKSGTAKNC